MRPLLEVKNLSIRFENEENKLKAVDDISFSVFSNDITAIIGESGSGKTLTALSLLQLLPANAITTGQLLFSEDFNKRISLSELSKKEIYNIRGRKIAMIFQDPMSSLNPLMTCGEQIMEVITIHLKINKKEAKRKTIELLHQVELPNPAIIFDRFPHQISGGQKQRIMIAMAISCNPCLIIADEPTTALDVLVQKKIVDLLIKLQRQNNFSILLITHDLGLVADMATKVIVLQKGRIVEEGEVKEVLLNPKNNYTKALLNCRPTFQSKGKKLPVVNENSSMVSNLVIEKEMNDRQDVKSDSFPILSVQDLKVYFPIKKNFFGKPLSFQKAIDGISFDVFQNETIGIVGESGCGKTTLSRTILQLIKPTSGKIFINRKDIFQNKNNSLSDKKELQIVFQNPYGTLNPRITVENAIIEPLQVHRIKSDYTERKDRVRELFHQVGLNPNHVNRYPHQFSGGQQQRICIARALALEPQFLIFDESVSALDVSIQAQILNLINELKSAYKFTSIFISHDLSVIHYVSDRILVMNHGKIVEEGLADKIIYNPEHKYTQQLIDAIPGKNIYKN